VLPAAQTVPPVHPCPPHCPYFGTTAPVAAGAEVVVFTAEVVLVVLTEVARVVGADEDLETAEVTILADTEGALDATGAPPAPTVYTPAPLAVGLAGRD